VRLLCVEDEAALREDIVEYLRLKAYEVDEAASGEEAIDCLSHSQYDLVLCDIKMPRMDGFELLRQVRSENQLTTVPFLFLSALNERDDKLRAHESGCDGYLTKPIDFSVLDATLKSHINRQRARDFLYTTRLDTTQQHMISAMDDALNGSIAQAGVMIEHLRETVPVLTPSALSDHLATVQDHVNAHMLRLHMFNSTLRMQALHTECLSEIMLTNDIIKNACEECHHNFPSASVQYKASSSSGDMVQGDIRMLTRAIAGLLAAVSTPFATTEIIKWEIDTTQCTLTVADHPAMMNEQGFMAIDEATNLVALSNITRRRLIPLTYAMQAAHAHDGTIELLLWSDDCMAVRFVLPQPSLENVRVQHSA
jgi:DNA-binding response OmpR family regulator